MRIVTVPQLEDNYGYLIIDEGAKEAAAVDPVEPTKVIDAANAEGVAITTVLTTHHHWDHAGGNAEMAKRVPGVKVVGGAHDKVAACTHPVNQGDEVTVGKSITVKALFTPSHTKGHISYFVTDQGDEPPAVFTGDTLFIGGCGRFFEGTPEQMHHSLLGVLGKLDPTTRVFCGHEYTDKNLEFAASVDPDNQALQRKAAWVKETRGKGQPTVPSTIGEELEYNPFMRVDSEALKAATRETDPVAVMAKVRSMKDSYGKRGKI